MSHARYTAAAAALHWFTALLIVAAFSIGLYAVGQLLSPTKLKLYAWHKWVGITILVLTLVRLTWRWRHPAPELPATVAGWQRIATHATHAALYVLLIAVPLTGWLMSSAAGFPVVYFGLLALPDLIAKDDALSETLKGVHYGLNKTLVVVAVLHAAAALKHHFVDRDDVLRRMWPWRG